MPQAVRDDAPVVVFVHVHYDEVWPSIVDRLANRLHVPFRLVVTTTTEMALPPPVSPWLREFQTIAVENRGRDVRPFQIALKEAGSFEVGLKLHSKRSPHRLNGDAWREAILNALLPEDPQRLDALLARMREDPRIGFVAPDGAFCHLQPFLGNNWPGMRAAAERIGFTDTELVRRTPYFAPGTMFWFRRDALSAFAEADLDDLFLPENGETDGTTAHALERLFAPIAAQAGAVPMPIEAVMRTRRLDATARLRNEAARHASASELFVHVPGRVGEWVMRYTPFLIPVYRHAPKGLRRTVKRVLGNHASEPAAPAAVSRDFTRP